MAIVLLQVVLESGNAVIRADRNGTDRVLVAANTTGSKVSPTTLPDRPWFQPVI
jgi:hypothetical protein